MPKILIVYCSLTGNTKAAAEAIAEGAQRAGAEVAMKGERKSLLNGRIFGITGQVWIL